MLGGGNRYRRHQHRRSGVGEEQSNQRRQQEHRRQQRQGAEGADAGHQAIGDQAHAAGLFQRLGQRQHPGDHHQARPVDRAIGILQTQAAEQAHGQRRQQDRHGVGQQAKGHDHDHRQQDQQGKGRPAVSRGNVGEFRRQIQN